jgi:hypothetical protein
LTRIFRGAFDTNEAILEEGGKAAREFHRSNIGLTPEEIRSRGGLQGLGTTAAPSATQSVPEVGAAETPLGPENNVEDLKRAIEDGNQISGELRDFMRDSLDKGRLGRHGEPTLGPF